MTLEDNVKVIIKNIGKLRTFPSESEHLMKDLNFDSLDKVEMSFMLEEEFGFDLSDDIWGQCHTVEDTINIVKEYS